jgi:DNA adenine methylase
MKSPVRYPGGKTRAVKMILPHLPQGEQQLCSPFFGGGSIEIAYAQQNKNTEVYGYDLFEPIAFFWEQIIQDPEALANEIEKVKATFNKEQFLKFREELTACCENTIEDAAKVFAINRSSFSGATFSGGFSKQAEQKRFNKSSIERVRNFKVPNLKVKQGDFKDTIPKHENAFLYLDPPYFLKKGSNNLYGANGSTHKGFDHQGLFNLLKERENWVLSYNDCEWVRETYKNFEIIDLSWSYGMNKGKNSSELLIKA